MATNRLRIACIGAEIEADHIDGLLAPADPRNLPGNLQRRHEQHIFDHDVVRQQSLDHQVTAFLRQGGIGRGHYPRCGRFEISRGDIQLRARTFLGQRLLDPVVMEDRNVRGINPLGIVEPDNQ